ncbi:MAG: TetR/AcrR family transcriptional regulator [Candidatus Coprovivens sp.]
MKKLKEYKTKTLIVRAFFSLLEKKSFDEIRVNEICDVAMVHKTTFYNHFEDKYDLLNFIVKELHNDIKNKADTNNGIIAYYLSIARLYIEKAKENPDLINALNSSRSDGLSSYMLYDIYVKDVEEQIANLDISMDIPARYIADFYVSAVFSLLNSWFRNGMKEDEETIIKYIDFLIRSPK